MTDGSLDSLSKRLGVPFKDKDLWIQALTHRSYAHENKNDGVYQDNERLEFLGDSVIELAVRDFLYARFPTGSEGELALMRTSIVRSESLARAARRIDLGSYLRLGKGEEATGGRKRSSILCDAFEAVTAAVYLEHGWKKAQSFVWRMLEPELSRLQLKSPAIDAKSALQELLQARSKLVPTYQIVEQRGPDHDRTFVVAVMHDGVVLAHGAGRSRRAAEQDAAANALKAIQN